MFFFVLQIALSLQFAVAKPELQCAERAEMGTPFKICVFAEPEEKLGVQFELTRAFDEIRKINLWMSDWLPNTELSKVNQRAGAQAVQVRKELIDLVSFTLKVSEQSQGAFDPTFNVFFGLYNFKQNQEREPSEQERSDLLPLIDYRNLVVDQQNQTLFLKKPRMKIGLGAVGQGYAVDAIVPTLKKRFKAGFVDGSGDTYFWGEKPSKELWTITIRDPRDHKRIVGRLYGTDFAVTTSGDDEKFFMKGDRRVHHVIDPRTGLPTKGVRQVTVISSSALVADAWDTASMVMGVEKGQKILPQQNVQAVFVTDNGVRMTSGLRTKKTQWGEVIEIVEKITASTSKDSLKGQ